MESKEFDLDGVRCEIDYRGEVTLYGGTIEAYGGHSYQERVTLDEKQMMKLIAEWFAQKVKE